MDIPKHFKVAVRRKVPYLTNLFLWIGIPFLLVLLVFDLLFYPLRHAGPEVQSSIFFFLVPEFWKKVLLFSAISVCVTFLIYCFLRHHKSALLLFKADEIIIRGRTLKLSIPLYTIKKIYCNDATTAMGEPTRKFSVSIEQKSNNAVVLKIKHYDDVDAFMERLSKYKDVEIKFYNFRSMPIHMEEE